MLLLFGLNNYQLRVSARSNQHCLRISSYFVLLAKHRNQEQNLSWRFHLKGCIGHLSMLQNKKPMFRHKNDNFAHSLREHSLRTRKLTSKANYSFSCWSSFLWNKAKVLVFEGPQRSKKYPLSMFIKNCFGKVSFRNKFRTKSWHSIERFWS